METLIESHQYLLQYAIKPSVQRSAVMDFLLKNRIHPTIDEIYSALAPSMPTLSKTTVYNTLNLFRDRGLIREVIIDPKRVFYDPNTTPHHHLYNVDTGEITDIESATLSVSGLPELPPGMVTEGVDIIVRVRASAASLG